MRLKCLIGSLVLATVGLGQALGSPQKPLRQDDVLELVRGGVSSERVADLVQERGIDFELTMEYIESLRTAGAANVLIEALRVAKGPVQKTLARQHVARAVEFEQRKSYVRAEDELRAALRLDPASGEVHVALGGLLMRQERWDEAVSTYRAAARLKPGDATAHNNLGVVLAARADAANASAARTNILWSGEAKPEDRRAALDEYRLAYQLLPGDSTIRANYEAALRGYWPSLIIDPGAPLPRTWSDVWRFYINHPVVGWTTVEQCPGELSVGNGRIKHSCAHRRNSFECPLSEVKEVKKHEDTLVIRLRNGRRYEFGARDRMGDSRPVGPLLDAILQAMGK
jgi:Tfp pilus assembly protein PilF